MSINRAFPIINFTIHDHWQIFYSTHPPCILFIHSIKTASIPIETFHQKTTFRQNFILPCYVTVNSSRSNDQWHLVSQTFIRSTEKNRYDPGRRTFRESLINVLIAVRRVVKSCRFLYVRDRNTVPKYSRFNDFFNEITRDAHRFPSWRPSAQRRFLHVADLSIDTVFSLSLEMQGTRVTGRIIQSFRTLYLRSNSLREVRERSYLGSLQRDAAF